MTTQTATGGIPNPPQIQGGEAVYNMIMKEIEPELTTDNLPKMDAQYANETVEEKKARAERYKKAFLEYKKQYDEYARKQDEEVRAYGRTVMGAVESKSASRDAGALDDIESAISNS